MGPERNPVRGFAARLRVIREKRGLTQAELAALIGRSLNAVSRLERGVNKPTFDNLCRLAETLGVPVGDFFAGSDGNDGGNGADGQSPSALFGELLDTARALPPDDLKLAAGVLGLMVEQQRGEAV